MLKLRSPARALMRKQLFINLILHSCFMACLSNPSYAQQPIRPITKTGSCPLGYYSSGNYCVPSSSGNTRGAIEKSSSSCPLGFFSSGNYCLSNLSNEREAIQKLVIHARLVGLAPAVIA